MSKSVSSAFIWMTYHLGKIVSSIFISIIIKEINFDLELVLRLKAASTVVLFINMNILQPSNNCLE